LKPRYDAFSFGNIANTMEHMLTGSAPGQLLPVSCFGSDYPRPHKIVLIFIDAFGWRFWTENWERYKTTRQVVQNGRLTPISAVFPSTTAASVASLNLGVLPAQHALLEWNLYIPAYGEVIQSLPFSPLGGHTNDACLAKGYDPAKLLDVKETFHHRVTRKGTRSIMFAHQNYAGGAANRHLNDGAEVIRHRTLAEALVQLKEALIQTEDKAVFNLYWGSIDMVGHIYGAGTSYHDAEIASFWCTFDDIFSEIDSPNTLFMFTADHGMMSARAEDTLYINEALPEFTDYIAVSPTGNRIYPGGAPRDMFLHIKPEHRETAYLALQQLLDGIAYVFPMDKALNQGLFGPLPVGAEFRRRIGDILVLPYEGRYVWWREKGIIENTMNGHHGGLSPDELITVLGVVNKL
jgi:predicted AlkP superfamily pyrophosphatase or phosphodiesterase